VSGHNCESCRVQAYVNVAKHASVSAKFTTLILRVSFRIDFFGDRQTMYQSYVASAKLVSADTWQSTRDSRRRTPSSKYSQPARRSSARTARCTSSQPCRRSSSARNAPACRCSTSSPTSAACPSPSSRSRRSSTPTTSSRSIDRFHR